MSVSRLLQAGCLIFPMLVCAAGAQSRPNYAPAVAMPPDRVKDSYDIYSQLLPSNVIEWGDVQRTQWLVEDVSHAEPLGSECVNDGAMNPHKAIIPPDESRAAFADVLADFDAHCHVRFQLDSKAFHVALPIRLLDESDQGRFVQRVAGFQPPPDAIMQAPPTPNEFKGAAGMHSFTAVYFNRAHTLAMAEIGMYCGSLCGNSTWVMLERTSAGWQRLSWAHTTTFS